MVVGAFAVELDTVVVGSGPGGYVAAIRAAQMGQKVAIIEREFIGGVCLNVGCIPSKALISAGHAYHNAKGGSEVFGVKSTGAELDFQKTQEWKDNEVVKTLTGGVEMLLKKNKVEIIRGEAFFNNERELTVVGEMILINCIHSIMPLLRLDLHQLKSQASNLADAYLTQQAH